MSSMSSVHSAVCPYRLQEPEYFCFCFYLAAGVSVLSGFKTPDGRFTLALSGSPAFRGSDPFTGLLPIQLCGLNTGGVRFWQHLWAFCSFLIAYTDLPRKPLIHNLLLVPLVIPGYIITLAWIADPWAGQPWYL